MQQCSIEQKGALIVQAFDYIPKTKLVIDLLNKETA
jgi:hypothetical protein